jgi:hypothetical protein
MTQSNPSAERDWDSHQLPQEKMELIRRRFQEVSEEPNAKIRGFAFERFLDEFFDAHGLRPRGSFHLKGTQIDGAFEWEGDIYKVEARWRKQKANTKDLDGLHGGTLTSKWTGGVFISVNGFSPKINETYRIGKPCNLIAISGDDLRLILDGRWGLDDALRAKRRHVAEMGEVYWPLPATKEEAGDA